jgi:hypothetical protein
MHPRAVHQIGIMLATVDQINSLFIFSRSSSSSLFFFLFLFHNSAILFAVAFFLQNSGFRNSQTRCCWLLSPVCWERKEKMLLPVQLLAQRQWVESLSVSSHRVRQSQTKHSKNVSGKQI